jgi:hypothetical protein
MEPLSHRIATDRALIHLGRALAASALVAAWDRGVRLGVDEADDARGLTADGGLGNQWPTGVKLRGGQRHHRQRRRPVQRHRSRSSGLRCLCSSSSFRSRLLCSGLLRSGLRCDLFCSSSPRSIAHCRSSASLCRRSGLLCSGQGSGLSLCSLVLGCFFLNPLALFVSTCASSGVASAAAPACLLLRLPAASFSGLRACLALGRAVHRE